MRSSSRCIGTIALLALAAVGCGGTDIEEFGGYGTDMPGSGLADGGEVLLEKIFMSPGLHGGEAGVVNTFYAFQYGGAFEGATDYPAPGECHLFDHPNTFPLHDIPAGPEDYVDWGADISLTGPGLGSALTVPKVIAPAGGLIDNRPSPIRNHREGTWIYGGLEWQSQNFQQFDIQEGEYTVDLNLDSGPLTFNFPPAYDRALDIGTVDIEIPRTAPEGGLEITWEAIPNPDTPHSRLHTFAFFAFAQFPEAGDLGPTPLVLCQPPDTEDGSLVIPQEILDVLPDMGIAQTGRLSHYMEKLTDNDGVDRRFDLFSIYCSVSVYTKVD